MEVRRQHDDGVGKDVRRVGAGKQGLSGGARVEGETRDAWQGRQRFGSQRAAGINSPLVAFQISGGKFLHEPVYLLGFSGEPEALQENPQCRDKVFALEVHLIHVGVHHLFIEAVVIPQEFSHLSLNGGEGEEGEERLKLLNSLLFHPVFFFFFSCIVSN